MSEKFINSVIESKTVLVEKLGFSVTLTQLCYWYRDAVTRAESYQVAVLNDTQVILNIPKFYYIIKYSVH